MICPYCGKAAPDRSEFCAECGFPLDGRQPLREEKGRGAQKRLFDARVWRVRFVKLLRGLLFGLVWVVSIFILCCGVYKGYYWYRAGQSDKLYESGMLPRPLLEQVELSDGREGHAVSFYGEDGDMIYIEELRQSYLVVGGEARVEIADSYWFETASNDIDMAEIALTPIQTLKSGEKKLLPVISFEVSKPTSPLNIISPGEEQEPILSSEYQLVFEVVPGSTVLVDGQDVTDFVSSQGEVSVNVAVYPQGDNPISILVQTPHHKEARADIVLYRQPMEIDLELLATTSKTSALQNMKINGRVDSTATVTVETPYVEGSFTQDEDGDFSFVAQFDQIGNNTVRFRATEEGKADSVISFEVYYLPTLSEYSRKAWVMDYVQLTRCWDIWAGHIFKCTGTVEAILSYEPQVLVLDVSEDESGQFLIIENESNLSVLEIGDEYDFYADVSGTREEYMGKDYPLLTGRYANLVEE